MKKDLAWLISQLLELPVENLSKAVHVQESFGGKPDLKVLADGPFVVILREVVETA